MSAFAQAVVAHLTLAANSATVLAVGWHIAGAGAGAALLGGWKPSKRGAGRLLAVPVVSSAVVAFVFGNPFNGAVLTAVAFTLTALAGRLDAGPVTSGSVPTTALGILMIAFGAVYPHFLAVDSKLAYLYAAPTGVVPCPTLAVVVGVTLATNGLASRAWSLTIAAAGLFYGVVGVALLGVALDVLLVAGAMLLVLTSFLEIPERRPT